MSAARQRRTSDNVLYAVLGGLVCVVLTTGTAVAVSTTAVTITNPTTGKTAHVTNLQSLVTSPRDPFSGTYARLDASGRQLVGDGSGALSVDGTVGTRPLLPSKPWSTGIRKTVDQATTRTTFYEGVGSNRLALTSATFASNTQVTAFIAVAVHTGSTSPGCDFSTGTWAFVESVVVIVPAGDTVDLNWPTPRLLSQYGTSSNYVCAYVEAASSAPTWSMFFDANGFLV
jgi:hypothetical protein